MQPERSLLPREHGAYGQLAFPALSALVSGRPTLASASLVVAAVGAFLAHEPLLVLLGRRGSRARREDGRRATTALGWTLALSIVAGSAALVFAEPAALVTIAAPLAFAPLVLFLVLRQLEKTLVGEILVAFALASVAFPVAVMEGSTMRAAAELSVAWGVAYSVATASVRDVVRCGREGTRRPLPIAAALAGVVAAAIFLARLTWVHWSVPAALAPFVAISAALAAAPPHPRHMKRVGWAIVGASTLTLVSLVVLHR